MGIGSGLGGDLGIALETTYGTYVAPTRFVEVANAQLKKRKKTVQGGGVAGGRLVAPGARRLVTTRDAGGPIKSEVVNVGMGIFLATALGSHAVPVQIGSSAAWTQTHSIGDPYGLSFSAQVGLPDETGTVHPYSYLGCKIHDATWECGIDEILTQTFTVDAQDVTESQSLAAPSYPTTPHPFNFGDLGSSGFLQGAFGSETAVDGVRKVTVKLARSMRLDRYYQNSSGLKKQPIINGLDKITGTIDVDYITKADFADRFAADTPFSIVWTMTGPQIATSGTNCSISFALPNCFLDDTFDLAGLDVVTGALPFTALSDQVHPALTITYVSGDTVL